MNKYQYRAVLVALLAIISSFVVWTGVLQSIPLPHIQSEIVTQFETILQKLSQPKHAAAPVTVHEEPVEDLGSHFVESLEERRIEASIVEVAEYIVETEAIEEIEESGSSDPQLEIEEINDHQQVIHAAAQELEQWGLSRTWSITIPSLGIRAPVLLPSMQNWTSRAWDVLEEQMQIGLNHGAVAYPNSAGPGKVGNLIIAGHSSPPTESARSSQYGDVFAKLPNIEVGQEISIVSAGSPITYRVEEKTVVSPQTTSILEQQSDERILKLITCYPVGTTRDRMVVVAKRVED